MFWAIVVNVAIAFVSSLLYKPPAGPQAANAKDFSTPRSEEGDAIYDFAGTVWVADSHVVWQGDFRSQGIYKKGGKK